MINNFSSKTDFVFDSLLPKRFQEISKVHWTPKKIIEVAINWFKECKTSSVLDIGSGVGKFCVIGAQKSDLQFTGVELRKILFKQAVKIKEELSLSNVEFINENILNVNFNDYDGFYYFNPFLEQIHEVDRIDESTIYSPTNFSVYENHVLDQLNNAKIGTAVITYCSPNLKLSNDFTMKQMMFDGMLELWVKEC